MNDEERRSEVLKAEAAIRELAGRMVQASESTKQADNARGTLESAIRSMDELKSEFQEEIKSLNQARESLDIAAKDIQKLRNLQQDITTISDKLLFLIDQNEASNERILALQRTIEEVQGSRDQVIDSNKSLSLKKSLEAKKSGISYRLRSAIIGGMGVGMVLMIIKLF